MGAALLRQDTVHASLGTFRRRVDGALSAIADAVREHSPVGISYSGGKDSEVVLDLVRRVAPDAPVAFFDSGCELESTRAMVRMRGATVIQPRLSMLDMARYAGWWDYASPVDKGCPFDAKLIVIQEPSETFVVRAGLRCVATGMRAEESAARSRHASRGELYQGRDRTWYLQPIIRWSLADVWAYIASRGLAYNAAYDRLTEAGVSRESQRVATLLGDRGAGWGRHALMRRAEPARWAEIAREFPGLDRMT